MEFAEATIRRLTPLQVRLPDQSHPLQTAVRPVAEAFVAETIDGSAVIWLEPFWSREPGRAWHVAYATPRCSGAEGRWVDQDPRYGFGCLVYQRPVVFEHLDRDSPAWGDYRAWLRYRSERASVCGRKAAWKHVEAVLGKRLLARRA
jgi:hypothetical protein